MKISTLSAVVAVLFTLSTPALGAPRAKRDSARCKARPSGGQPALSAPASSSSVAPKPFATPPAAQAPPPPSPPQPSPTHSSVTQAPPPPPKQPAQEPAPAPAPAPPNPNPAPVNGPTSSDDQSQYLDAHNAIRSQKGAVALTWSDDLAATAQQVANTCVFQHSGGPDGENLSAGTHPFSIAAAIKLWTDEESQYDPNNPQPSHYTQVVWKGSTQVGCAVASCPTLVDAFANADFYVCEYEPPGNIIGDFPDNVEP